MSSLPLSDMQQSSPNQTTYRVSYDDNTSMPPPLPPGQSNPLAISSLTARFGQHHFSSRAQQTPSPRASASQPYSHTITPVLPHSPFLTSNSSSFPQPTLPETSSDAASQSHPLAITTAFFVPSASPPPARFKGINTLDHLEKIFSDLKQLQESLLKWASNAGQKLINKEVKPLRSGLNEIRLTFLQITKDFSSRVPSAIYRQFLILLLVTQLVSLRLENKIKEFEESCEELKNEFLYLEKFLPLQKEHLNDLEKNSLSLRNQALDSMKADLQSENPKQFLHAIQSTVNSITPLLSILKNWTFEEIAITKAAIDISAPFPFSPLTSPLSSQVPMDLDSDSSRKGYPALFDPFNHDEKTPPPH